MRICWKLIKLTDAYLSYMRAHNTVLSSDLTFHIFGPVRNLPSLWRCKVCVGVFSIAAYNTSCFTPNWVDLGYMCEIDGLPHSKLVERGQSRWLGHNLLESSTDVPWRLIFDMFVVTSRILCKTSFLTFLTTILETKTVSTVVCDYYVVHISCVKSSL